MLRPGQLYQMDIEGKMDLNGLGWVYGIAVIDDFSRFVPAVKYYPDMRMSNAHLDTGCCDSSNMAFQNPYIWIMVVSLNRGENE